MFKLVIQDDEGKTTVVPLIRDEITIGRKEGNTIRLTERNVSRRHARILRSDNEVQIEDLGSYNGIRVNNARIAERVSLRLSDQVQIGDYKLYLKAEGVEQVDEARTMPIERIETPPGEVPVASPTAPAIAPAPIPTTPMPAQRPPAGMAVADTDPAGRPVATAAQVAALTAPAGYGKFIVISSNFAGKELDLTRPQLVIGRTEDNDLVLNHRSISRNHAKITRDTETQRYTISDLQSSNGVRVNGQDYGKVELRRGDVVDLGHVRLRFVEPGEDFVFSQAVVTDVPEGGGKRGLLVAAILAIVVLGAVVAYFAFKTSPSDSGTHGTVENGSAGSNFAGSGGSAIAVAAADVDAGTSATTGVGSNDTPELKRFEGDCYADITDKKWGDLETCADQLDGIQKSAGQKFRAKAKLEIGAGNEIDDMRTDLKNKNLKSAQRHLANVPPDSVQLTDAKDAFEAKKKEIRDDAVVHARGLARNRKCEDFDRYVSQQGGQYGDDVAAAISAAVKCDASAVSVPPTPLDCSTTLVSSKDARCKAQFCAGHEGSPLCGAPEPAQSCEALLAQGASAQANLDHAAALKAFEKAYQCRSDPHTISLAFLEACSSANVPHARLWWKKLSAEAQNHDVIICVRNNITREQLDASQ